MIGFTPPGCISCIELLGSRYKMQFPDYPLPSANKWEQSLAKPYSYRTITKSDKALYRVLAEIVRAVQADLYEGRLIACYAESRGLIDIKPNAFAVQAAGRCITHGKYFPDNWSPLSDSADMFFRDPKDIKVELGEGADSALEPRLGSNKGGRLNTQVAVATVYSLLYPDGLKGQTFGGAARAVSDAIEGIGGPSVSEKTLRRALKKYPKADTR